MIIDIDKNAGFCFGVDDAIKIAEKELSATNHLYCLGDIVHNDVEVKRLENNGVEMIDHHKFSLLKNQKVLIRAHGESPEIYRLAKENNISIVDATCPIVFKLQERVKKACKEGRVEEQIVIFGQVGHAEAVGLTGQIDNKAIIIESVADLSKIKIEKPITIFSQTTKSNINYLEIVSILEDKIKESDNKHELRFNKTVCGQVANRDKDLKEFARQYDLLIFVSGKKSSNGKMLFNVCETANKMSFKVSDVSEIKKDWFTNIKSIGISGATSTPLNQLETVKSFIESIL